jgi:hypothetical protein
MLESDRNAPQFYMPLAPQPSQAGVVSKSQIEALRSVEASPDDKNIGGKTAAIHELRPSRSKP